MMMCESDYRSRTVSRVLAGVVSLLGLASLAQADPAKNYQLHCAACHGLDRLGGTGPALLAQT